MFKFRTHYLFLALLLAGCTSRTQRQPVIGEGFVAPASLNLRRELGPRQPSVATVRHGERVSIIDRRRVFVKVRTSTGVEGWTDGRLLFTPEQMEDMQWLAEQVARLPSQGAATAYGKLNIHTDPNRASPSFHQLKEGDHVDVVAHRLAPRVPYDPDNPAPVQTENVAVDDWSVVRTKNGDAGWVLFRMLVMSIPDEVAQYAEGHRITSYFSLGDVKDGQTIKHNWLWTTITSGQQPYEFDSFRVFVWSRRRHHYETAYIERNVKGYYPVQVHQDGAGKTAADPSPSFSLVIADKDGIQYRRTYAFQGYRIRMVSKLRWNPADIQFHRPEDTGRPDRIKGGKSLLTRLKEKLSNLGW